MKKKRNYLRWICNVLSLVVVLAAGACASPTPPPVVKMTVRATLPGQQIWKQGVSSYLFGTNNTREWSDNTINTQPKFQQALRGAGFTLIRTFFFKDTTDPDIEKRMQTVENSGAQCLGVITDISTLSFSEHIVRKLGDRCQMYEFGNEADWAVKNISVEYYLQQWNTIIPALRRINPDAHFIGPVTTTAEGDNNFMHDFLVGVKASGVLPDAVSFHWYPCDTDTEETCLSYAKTAGTAAGQVEAQVQAILGKTLPIGITEWNYDSNTPPPSYGDKADFITKFSTDALSSMIDAGVAFACQFDAASYAGYGRLDMFDTTNNKFKPQYYAIKEVIGQYKPSDAEIQSPTPTSE